MTRGSCSESELMLAGKQSEHRVVGRRHGAKMTGLAKQEGMHHDEEIRKKSQGSENFV
jgi:hypothetical protein